jgi:hypothetical protein
MAIPDISERVWRFIADNIDTVPQLEALLLLCESEGQGWTLHQVAARIYVSEEAAREILRTLQQRSLICMDATATLYRCVPATGSSAGLLDEVAKAYRRNIVPIATFIHSKAPASVREFARAFDFKKDR